MGREWTSTWSWINYYWGSSWNSPARDEVNKRNQVNSTASEVSQILYDFARKGCFGNSPSSNSQYNNYVNMINNNKAGNTYLISGRQTTYRKEDYHAGDHCHRRHNKRRCHAVWKSRWVRTGWYWNRNTSFNSQISSKVTNLRNIANQIYNYCVNNCNNNYSYLTVDNNTLDDGFNDCRMSYNGQNQSFRNIINQNITNYTYMCNISQNVINRITSIENEGGTAPQKDTVILIDNTLNNEKNNNPMDKTTTLNLRYHPNGNNQITVSIKRVGNVKTIINRGMKLTGYSDAINQGPTYTSTGNEQQPQNEGSIYNIAYVGDPPPPTTNINQSYIGLSTSDDNWYEVNGNSYTNVPYVLSDKAYETWGTCKKAIELSEVYNYGTDELYEFWGNVENSIPGQVVSEADNILTEANRTCNEWVQIFNVWEEKMNEARSLPCAPERPNERSTDQGDILRINNFYDAAKTRIQALNDRLEVIKKYITPYPTCPPVGSAPGTTEESNEMFLKLKPNNITFAPYSIPAAISIKYDMENRTPGEAPNQYLEMIVPNGKPGEIGPRGICGIDGKQGKDGNKGGIGDVGNPVPESYYN